MAEKIFTQEQLEKFREFMESPGKRFLAYHGDADGACSAAMLLRFFKGLEYSPRKGPAMGEDFIQVILKKKPGLLVFIDLPVDQEMEKLKRVLKEIPGLRIIILDHHIAERDVNSGRVIHINPRFLKKDVYIPAACMVYRLLERLGKDVKHLVWIAALGTIGDYGWEGCPELIEECRKEFPFLMEGEPQESKLGEGANVIASATTLKGLKGVAGCLKVLEKAQGYEDFESSKRLQDWHRELEEELQSNCLISKDHRKGVQAFLEKSDPEFTGE